MAGRMAALMVANSGGSRTVGRGQRKFPANYLTHIGEIAIMIGFVRRGSRAVKGIRL